MRRRKQTILITGAARRIGAALARHLARQGYDLVLHYATSKKEAAQLAKELRAKGATVTLVGADLADTRSLRHFWKELPACSAFIHNASSFRRDTLASLTPDALREHLAVHLEAPLILAQGFLKQLPKQASGSIIILGDGTLGWSIAPQFFSYAVSKHALTATVDILAAAVAPKARANVIALGPTLRGTHDTKQTFAMLAGAAPLQRTGALQEVTEAVDYLLGAPGVTGQVISLANGFSLATARRGFPAGAG